MRKLLLSSITLFLFSASIFVFQVSCQKDAVAENNQTQSEGKILFIKEHENGNINKDEIWVSNLDGSSLMKVPINLSENQILGGDAKVSKEKSKIIFNVLINDGSTDESYALYSCNLDGTNLTKIIEGSSRNGEYLFIQDIY
jgi:hypothetical protein